MKKQFVIRNKEETLKAIGSIQGRANKLQEDIHQAAVSCIDHLNKHGDTSLINRLVLAMPKSQRKNALIKWAIAFGKLAMNDDKATHKEMPLVYDKAKPVLELELAIAKPYWEFVAEEGEAVFKLDTVTKYVHNIIKKAESNGFTQADVMKAILAGGVEIDTIVAVLEDVDAVDVA